MVYLLADPTNAVLSSDHVAFGPVDRRNKKTFQSVSTNLNYTYQKKIRYLSIVSTNLERIFIEWWIINFIWVK